MIRTGQDQSWLAKNGQDWSGLIRNGQEWSGMTRTDQNWSKGREEFRLLINIFLKFGPAQPQLVNLFLL